ncbi:MAG: SMC-Scp complex subunit ScpB [Firmicutes bacterium]|nr:SMC-Scp complex subunit ScpB [Bacillota bacterium]
MMNKQSVKSALESILFVWGEPLEAKTAADLFELPLSDMLSIFRELASDYEERGSGLMIREIDKAFQLCTNPENDDYIRQLCTPVKEKRLSQAALEVLAIVAYKQPVGKSEIDSIRGIKSERVLEGLMEKGLVEEKGRSTAIGRPILYGTTRNFLALFGFETLEDLPRLEDLDSILLDSDQLTIPMDIMEGNIN